VAVRFEALEPTFAQVNTMPTYKARFVDVSSGNLADPDSVDKVEIKDEDRNVLRTYMPPEIDRIGTGLYEVDDVLVTEQQVLYVFWYWTEGGSARTAATAFEVFDTTDRTVEKKIKQDVLQKLGQGHVHVHLPEGTLDTCYFEAVKWYVTYRGEMHTADIDFIEGQQKFDIADDCYYVYTVDLPFSSKRLSDAFGAFGLFGLDFLNISDIPADEIYHSNGFTGNFYSTLTMAKQYGEMASRVLGGETGWEWLPTERKLVIIPEVPQTGPGRVKYISTQVTFGDNNPNNASPRKYLFLQNYTLAVAKEALGRIRSKFNSFPGAESDIQLDGDTLLSEGQKMKDNLTEALQGFQRPGHILQG
jgi:hypothetical protein